MNRETAIPLRLVRRMAAGARLVPHGEAFRLAPHGDAVTGAVARRLLAAGLAGRDFAGAVVLAEAGKSWLRRRLAEGDGFAEQHRRDEPRSSPADPARPALVNLAESPLAWLRRRRGADGRPLLGEAEFAAGERLRADFTRGQMMPRITANWTAPVARGRRSGDGGGPADLTEAALSARFRVEQALGAVGPDFAGLLVDFCCFLRGIEEIERERGWPARSAKLVLRLALAALARHYGLAAAATGPMAGRIRHWGAEDYRPNLG